MMADRLPPMLRRAIWEVRGEKCAYCHKPLQYHEVEIDHIIPQWLEHDPAAFAQMLDEYVIVSPPSLRSLENLAPACGPCNRGKAGKVFRFVALHLELAARMAPQVEMRYQVLISENRANPADEMAVDDTYGQTAPSVWRSVFEGVRWDIKIKFWGDSLSNNHLQKAIVIGWLFVVFTTLLLLMSVWADYKTQPTIPSIGYTPPWLLFAVYSFFYTAQFLLLSLTHLRWVRRKKIRGWS